MAADESLGHSLEDRSHHLFFDEIGWIKMLIKPAPDRPPLLLHGFTVTPNMVALPPS